MIAPEPPAVDLRIVSTGATPEELAAVTAVLQGALAELTPVTDADVVPVMSAWERSLRPIRGTLAPGVGAWRGFTA